MDSLANLCLKTLPYKFEPPKFLRTKYCDACCYRFLPKFSDEKFCGQCICNICNNPKNIDCPSSYISKIKPKKENKEIYITSNKFNKTCKNECNQQSNRRCLISYFTNESCQELNCCWFNKNCYMCLEYKKNLYNVNLYTIDGHCPSFKAVCFSCIKRIKTCQVCNQPLLKMYKEKQEERLKMQSLYATLADVDLKILDIYDVDNYSRKMILCAQCHIFARCFCTNTMQCFCPRQGYKCECICRRSKYFKNNVLCVKSKAACFNKMKIKRVPKWKHSVDYTFKSIYKLINV
ncbi:host cell factor-1 [Plutella xylostella multiple nucleopolyhedrovirus]|uniref:Host cell factor-1 n=1 Tax=Plutella xylostella multiple nucleopolyhedrovirus TaxID=379891 RepID=Q0GYF2_9ABAC|nr:host cell factor-1 [Plutella xylostella multiple nucleopolyhedrovirus]